MTINESITGVNFLADLDYVSASVAEGRTRFVMKHGDEIIMDETYTPNQYKVVIVDDLYDLLRDYFDYYLGKFRGSGLTSFDPCLQITYSFTDSTGTKTESFWCIYNTVKVADMDAYDFMANYFLTASTGERTTAPGRKERVGWLTDPEKEPVAERMYLELVYMTPGHTVRNKVVELGISQQKGYQYKELEVDKYTDPTDYLLRMVLHVGKRSITFRIDYQARPYTLCLRFWNAFASVEYFYLCGQLTEEPKYKRNTTMVNNRLRAYASTEVREFTADTGYLTDGMMPVFDDLCASLDITADFGYMTRKLAGDERPLVITDVKSKRNDSQTGLFSFNIKFRYADRLARRVEFTGRVFDDTFDHTFN